MVIILSQAFTDTKAFVYFTPDKRYDGINTLWTGYSAFHLFRVLFTPHLKIFSFHRDNLIPDKLKKRYRIAIKLVPNPF